MFLWNVEDDGTLDWIFFFSLFFPFFKEKILEQKFKKMEMFTRVSRGRTLQAEETIVPSPRQKHAWLVKEWRENRCG